MNCPVRTEPFPDEGHNQNPPELAAELTTRRSLKTSRGAIEAARTDLTDGSHSPREEETQEQGSSVESLRNRKSVFIEKYETTTHHKNESKEMDMLHRTLSGAHRSPPEADGQPGNGKPTGYLNKLKNKLVKYAKFIGPGFLVSVAYIDPGNYATDVAAGASFRYRLLFMVLLSNIIAIFLQSLCIKLGTVTGMNLAENCKAHLPPWLNYVLYIFAECAIIATDIAEVIGTAIALNILFKIPLVAGCAISIVDVLVILLFYNPTGMSMRALRVFEFFVILLVLSVVGCFCFELSKVKDTTVGEVFKGYLPSAALVKSQGLYQSCGILGATVMPHSLYLGSGIVQSRLRDFDEHHNGLAPLKKASLGSFGSSGDDKSSIESVPYRPSLSAIRSCLNYSILELALSLITFALFVNSAILIVSGASLSSLPADQVNNADLFSIHDLLSTAVAPAAGTIFALALLLSGTSAGIVCTIAGQMVSEGQLSWTVRPWIRRLITRSVSIIPSIIIAAAVGRKGLSAALEASQVALSVILPFVSAPLLYFTWNAKVMRVAVANQTASNDASPINVVPSSDPHHPQHIKNSDSTPVVTTLDHPPFADIDEAAGGGESVVIMKNGWLTCTIAILVWTLITVMNVALLVLLGLGKSNG